MATNGVVQEEENIGNTKGMWTTNGQFFIGREIGEVGGGGGARTPYFSMPCAIKKEFQNTVRRPQKHHLNKKFQIFGKRPPIAVPPK